MKEPLPLATIHDAVLEFLQGRTDAVLYGAQAVNAYVDEPRMTQDVDIMALNGAEFAEELRQFLNEHFHIAVRVRNVRSGLGYRIYQVQKQRNRHLIDVRPVEELPPCNHVEMVAVLSPPDLIAAKLTAFVSRRGRKAKAGTDWRDLIHLLTTFPELKTEHGPVADCLRAAGVNPETMTAWNELVEQEILPDDEDDEFTFGR